MLKVGLIGCGFMGGMHYSCYDVIEGAQVVAVADVRQQKAQELIKGRDITVYETGEELIEKADVDIIDICLPTCLHTSHAVSAMKKGRKVFIEKPVCLNEEEGKILLEVQKETNAIVQVGQVIRLWDEYKWLKETAESNEYGKIKSAVFKRLSSVPAWGWNNWLHKAEMSGSVALDMHIHDVDFVRYLMGEPESFTSAVDRNEKGIIEQIFTTFKFKDAVAIIEACWDYPAAFPFDAGFRVKFEKATVVFDANGVTVYTNDGGQLKPEIEAEYTGNNDIGGNLSSLGAYYNELKYFVDKISAGEIPDIATLSEGVKSANLVLGEIKSVGGAQL